MIARISLDAVRERLFDYAVPAAIAAELKVGMRVQVPFGSRTCCGYVIECIAAAERPDIVMQPGLFGDEPATAKGRLRHIIAIDDPLPFFSPQLLQLLRWLAGYYCASMESALRSALPAPVRDGNTKARELLFVCATPQTEEHLKADSPSAIATQKLSARQRDLLQQITTRQGGLLNVLCRELKCAPETLRRLEKQGYLTIEPQQIRRDPLANRTIIPSSPLPLMPQQAAALQLICGGRHAVAADCGRAGLSETAADGCGEPSLPFKAVEPPVAAAAKAPLPVLLYGVTGSGKTEVYLQAIAHVLEQGGGAIVLVPEIALTPQTVRRFAGRFGDKIAVLHSALSEGERFDEWHRIRAGEAQVVVGPRSAVFAPVKNLALIIVDEEHEPSYKQDETPRYNARDVAVMRGWIEKCGVVLGSATPAMESWENVKNGKYRLARLALRAEERPMPTVEVIDMRIEGKRDGKPQIFSRRLIDTIEDRLATGEQVILFLNRRGYATSLLCTKCGFIAQCDSCSVAYTYHRTDSRLRCHICGACHPVPPLCPACSDPGFRYAGIGTQRIEIIAQTCFPKARIARLDADATTRKHSHDDILSAFRSGKTDILIGTQMIAKGHHFPNVTLVGVLMADAGLHIPDYRAGERTFQLLAQVSGRSGRGEIPGHVIIQTYTPDHPAIVASRTADFDSFATQERELRREAWLPPFSHVICLTFKGPDEEKVSFAANAFFKQLSPILPNGADCPEPMPSPLARAKGDYRYQMILRGSSIRSITRPLHKATRLAPPPQGVSLAIDVDALSIM